VTASAGGIAADTTGSGPPAGTRDPVEIGAASLGAAPPSRGYREEMEHLAYCIRMRDQGMESDRERLRPLCDGERAMTDAIVALTANACMASPEQKRIVFQDDWFDPSKMDAVPPVNLRVETV
jgi:hypothetical protein